uniref:Uncharacterized protein n=1 Tax=Anguilla anguilla TaxID=7936 RepID=A0A0E9UMV0_ANGAN
MKILNLNSRLLYDFFYYDMSFSIIVSYKGMF